MNRSDLVVGGEADLIERQAQVADAIYDDYSRVNPGGFVTSLQIRRTAGSCGHWSFAAEQAENHQRALRKLMREPLSR